MLELSNDGAHVRGFTSRGQLPALMSGRKDSGTVRHFCAGRGIPGSEISYTACALWRAQREAEWAARKGPDALRDEKAQRPPGGRDGSPGDLDGLVAETFEAA